MNSLSNFFKGVFIGAGAILPGISSGVICIVLGLYEKLLNSVLGFFKDMKENIKFLFPIATGAIAGIILFSNILAYCFNTIPCQTKSLFIGLLLGSLYLLAKSNIESFSYSKKDLSKYISFFVCFIIGISLIYLENIITFSTEYTRNEFSSSFLILSGFFMSIGIVVPGISNTIILMILGVYSTYLSAVSMVNMNVLVPMFIGIFIGSIIFMKTIQVLLDRFYSHTMFGIIGFSLGSVFILYPGYSFNLESVISIVILILGFIVGKNIKK